MNARTFEISKHIEATVQWVENASNYALDLSRAFKYIVSSCLCLNFTKKQIWQP